MTILYEQWEQNLRHLLPLLGGGVTVVSSPQQLAERVNADPEELLVVFGPSTALAEAVAFTEQCRLRRPALGVVLLRPHLDPTTVTQARRAGVREVVAAGDGPAVVEACARSVELSGRFPTEPPGKHGPGGVDAEAPREPAHGAAKVNGVRPVFSTGGGSVAAPPANGSQPAPPSGADPPAGGQIIAVFSGKGGTGKTVLATNLAVALAAGGQRRVCLVDLDLAFGDVALMLQLVPDRTLAAAIPVADRIDETGLRTLLTPYQAGVDTLLAPVQPADAEQVSRDLVAEILHLARGAFDFVVVDCASQFNDQMLAALDSAHHYLLVTTPELPALKSLRVTLDMFDLLDYRRERRIVVLNRADSKVGLGTLDVERAIRTPIDAFLPSSRDVPVSVNRGTPIVLEQPNHPVSTALRELVAKRFVADAPAAPLRGLRRLAGRRRNTEGVSQR